MQRIKVLFTLFLVLSIIPAKNIAAESKENLVLNPGFEAGMEGEHIKDWVFFPRKLNEKTYVDLNQEKVRSGEYSVKITDENTQSAVGIESNRMSVEPGKTYLLEGYGIANKGPGRVYIVYNDENGKELAEGKDSVEIKASLEDNNEWFKIFLETKAPEKAKTAHILAYVGYGVTAEVWFDDFSFQQIEREEMLKEIQYDEPIYLGDSVQTAMSQSSAFTTIDSDIYQFVGISGAPATFYSINHSTNEIKYKESLKNTNAIWGTHVAKNGKVYVSGTESGDIFEFDPVTNEMKFIAKLPNNHRHVWDIKSDETDLYIGTYIAKNSAGIFKYNFASEQIEAYAYAPEKVEYVRGLGISEHYVYAGIGGELGQIMRINKVTKEEEIIDVNIDGVKTPVMFSEVSLANGKIIASSGILLVIMDEETLAVEGYMRFDGRASSISPIDNDSIYFKDEAGRLRSYSLKDKEFTILKEEGILPLRNFRTAHWVKDHDGSDVLMFMTTHAEIFKYNPLTNVLTELDSQVDTNGVIVQSMERDNDGLIYMGGYMAGMSIYDPHQDQIVLNIPNFHQPEGIGFIGDEAFFGTYGGAVMYHYDAQKPYDYNEFGEGNPGKLFQIQDAQDRPFVLHNRDQLMYIGTFPTYGQLGGALTIYDHESKQFDTYRNIIEGHSIVGIETTEDLLYISTSSGGGLGQTAEADKAKVAILNRHTLEIIKIVTPELPNDKHPEFIGSISLGPDGNLWGVAVKDGIVFAMDPHTLEVIKYVNVLEGNVTGPGFRPYYIRWGHDGRLYTTAGKRLTVIDIETLEFKRIAEGVIHNIVVDDIGNVFYSVGAGFYKLPIITNEINISANKQYQVGEAVSLKIIIDNHFNNNQEVKTDLRNFEVLVDKEILSFNEGKITALKEGTTTIQLKLGSLESNTFEVTVVNAPEKETEKDPEKETEKDPEKETGKDPEKETEKDPEKESEKDSEKETEKDPEKDVVKDNEKLPSTGITPNYLRISLSGLFLGLGVLLRRNKNR